MPALTNHTLFPPPTPSIFTLPTESDQRRDSLLSRLLEDNQSKHHVFFNKRKYHNHISNHLLALWAMGGDKKAISAAYDHDSSFQLPRFLSPHSITDNNWASHLGDEQMYSAYLDYFTDVLRHNDISRVLEKYIFSESEMLSRFLGGLFHPVIFIGYGCEFRVPGILAEGLALTAVHPPVAAAIIPLFRCTLARPPTHTSPPIHVLCILDRIMKDETIHGGNHKVGLLGYKMYHWVIEHAGDVISKHVDDWADFDATNTDVVARKTEEIHWLATLLYAMSGFQAAQEDSNFVFKADFFTAHLVTSALFLPSITAFLKPASKRTFLRAYLYTGLVWWISRGKHLNVDGFFSVDVDIRVDVASSQSPSANGTNDRGGDAVHGKDSSQLVWSRIIKHAIHHPDDHLIKCQRSLYYFSAMYRHSQPFSAVNVTGFERLDSSLFLRAAILTAHRLENPPKGALKCWDVN